jgi:hypothetical protein
MSTGKTLIAVFILSLATAGCSSDFFSAKPLPDENAETVFPPVGYLQFCAKDAAASASDEDHTPNPLCGKTNT